MVDTEELRKIVHRVQESNGVAFSEIADPVFKRSGKYTICYLRNVKCAADTPPFNRTECHGETIGVSSKMDCDKEQPEIGQSVSFRKALELFISSNFEINTVRIAVPLNHDKETA